jgi:hypothetical protein
MLYLLLVMLFLLICFWMAGWSSTLQELRADFRNFDAVKNLQKPGLKHHSILLDEMMYCSVSLCPKQKILYGIFSSFSGTMLVLVGMVLVLFSSRPNDIFIVFLFGVLPFLWFGIWIGIFRWLELDVIQFEKIRDRCCFMSTVTRLKILFGIFFSAFFTVIFIKILVVLPSTLASSEFSPHTFPILLIMFFVLISSWMAGWGSMLRALEYDFNSFDASQKRESNQNKKKRMKKCKPKQSGIAIHK